MFLAAPVRQGDIMLLFFLYFLNGLAEIMLNCNDFFSWPAAKYVSFKVNNTYFVPQHTAFTVWLIIIIFFFTL